MLRHLKVELKTLKENINRKKRMIFFRNLTIDLFYYFGFCFYKLYNLLQFDMKMVAFILYRTAQIVNNFAQNPEIRVRVDVERLTPQMVGDINAVPDLIIYRPRHCRNRLAPAAAAVPVSR